MVLPFFDFRIGHRTDGGGGRHRRAGRGGKDRARADVCMHQPARKPAEPLRHRVVHPPGDAGPQHDLAKEDEHWDGDENELLLLVPDEFTHGTGQPPAHVNLVEPHRKEAQDRGHWHCNQHQPQSRDERPSGHLQGPLATHERRRGTAAHGSRPGRDVRRRPVRPGRSTHSPTAPGHRSGSVRLWVSSVISSWTLRVPASRWTEAGPSTTKEHAV